MRDLIREEVAGAKEGGRELRYRLLRFHSAKCIANVRIEYDSDVSELGIVIGER